MADNEEQRRAWIKTLVEQHPEQSEVIYNAADEASGFYGQDFGDHVLGCLEETGVEV